MGFGEIYAEVGIYGTKSPPGGTGGVRGGGVRGGGFTRAHEKAVNSL